MLTDRLLRAARSFVLGLALLAGLPLAASAQAIVSTGQSFIDGRLLPGYRQDDGTRIAGLRLSLADGWKTYWRSPGETGVPPEFDWSRSSNVRHVEVLWPRPETFMSFGLKTIGYRDRVLLPVVVTPEDPSLGMHLALTANVGVCKEICVLEQFEVAEAIAPDLRPIGAGQIDRAMANVPVPGASAGLRLAECRVTGAGRHRQLELSLDFESRLSHPEVLVEGTEEMWVTETESRHDGAGHIDVSAKLLLLSAASWIDRKSLRMTVLADGFSADVRGCTAPAG